MGRKSQKKSSGFKYIVLLLITFVILFAISEKKNDIIKQFYPLKYSEYVYKYSNQYNVDPFLVFSIIRVESNFNPKAQSKVGAKGLMQITDDTGAWIAKRVKLTDHENDSLFDPEYNIRMGCWYLNNLINQFGDITLALAAYNGGSGNVEKWLKNKEYSATGTKLDKIPFGETDKYIVKIKKDYSIYKNLYGNK